MILRVTAATLATAALAASVLPVPARAWATLLAAAGVASLLAGLDVLLARARHCDLALPAFAQAIREGEEPRQAKINLRWCRERLAQ